MNLSLNQILLTFLFCTRQTWMTQLIPAIFFERLSSFNPEGFYYSYAWSCSLCERRTSFCAGHISRKLYRALTYVFDWLYFTQCLTSFPSVDHLLRLYAPFLILFHLTWMRFSRSTHLLMCLSSETLTSIIRTD